MNETPRLNESPGAPPGEWPLQPFPLVGIGASAGGVQALQKLFDGLPGDIGMAFVVVMHLAPDHKSSLAHILQQCTSLTVTEVTETTAIVPNHVYVIPPNKHLAMEENTLRLLDPQQPTGRRVAIDLFFRTAAMAYRQRAICIVLSGSDADGVIGIKHIKEQGGLTIAQDPAEAEFDVMPRSAVATGMVDWVLPVAQIASQLVDFMRNERHLHVPPEAPPESHGTEASDMNSGGPLMIQQIPSTADEAALVEALQLLRAQTGQDFAHYKRATILRRIARRLQVNLLEDIPSYLQFLRSHPAEVTALLHDMLISVTNFFRDPEAFKALAAHIPQIFAGKEAGDQVRVWVSGCATGEEAYSIAMLLYEHASRLTAPPSIQVFASDLDEGVIQIARTGLYPMTIEADVSQERLRQFFELDHGRYRIRKQIRDIVLFSAHNLMRDSPFSRLDLVTCRNLLIYLKPEAQEGVFGIFHFALRPGSLLFLGRSESMEDKHPLFAPIDKRHQIYVRRSTPLPNRQIPAMPLQPDKLNALNPTVYSPVLPPPTGPIRSLEKVSRRERPNSSFADLHLNLLEQYAPPSVVVNARYDIVHLSDHAGQFLRFAGEASINLLKVVRPELRLDLRTALFRSTQNKTKVTTPPKTVALGGGERPVRMHVHPAFAGNDSEGFLLVLFETMETMDTLPAKPEPFQEEAVGLLENEIHYLRDQLSANAEQSEASIEEIRASNEEMQSINEEMRSTTEELETSKEELQSVNEELLTVNQELKHSVDELARANGDLQNLMAATEIGTIFLDREMRIKWFTPRLQELFNVIDSDIGRPLTDITHKLSYDNLPEDARRVLLDLQRSEREISSGENWYLGRMLPYRTIDNRIDGVVLTFVDITQRKQAEEELRQSEERFRAMVDQAAAGIVLADLSGCITFVNRQFGLLLGYPEEELLGKDLEALTIGEEDTHERALFTPVKAEGTTHDVEMQWRRSDGSSLWTHNSISAIYSALGKPQATLTVVVDVSARKRAEAAVLEGEAQFRAMFENTSVGMAECDPVSGRFLRINATLSHLTGYSNEELLQMTFSDLTHPDERQANAAGFDRLAAGFDRLAAGFDRLAAGFDRLAAGFDRLAAGFDRLAAGGDEGFEREQRIVRADGNVVWTSVTVNLVTNPPARPARAVVVLMDITQRIEAEKSLRQNEAQNLLTLENVTDYAIFALDTEGRVTSWNEGAKRVHGYELAEVVGRHMRLFYDAEDQAALVPEYEMEQARSTGRHEGEAWRVRKDGSRFRSSDILTLVCGEQGAVLSFVMVCRDLTKSKQAESERADLARETTLLAERNRMAQELHDTLAQGFTGIKLQIEAAEAALNDVPEQNLDALKHIVRAREITMQSQIDARNSIKALRAPLGEHGGLETMLERLTEEAPKNTTVLFFRRGNPYPLSVTVENDLYRIGQEALTNALRHAEAANITVELTYRTTEVLLRILDDGRGFEISAGRAGYGLTGMQERAARLEAEIQISSGPEQGTEVAVRLNMPYAARG